MVNRTTAILLVSVTASPHKESTIPSRESEEFGQFVESAPRTPNGRYVVDGDLPLRSIDDLYQYYVSSVFGERTARSGLAIYHGGADIKWNETTKLNLTYCVDSVQWSSSYWNVVNAMTAAAQSWKGAAYDFKHVFHRTPLARTAIVSFSGQRSGA